MKHAYPGAFGPRCDALQDDARRRGVCPKIVLRGGTELYVACGRPLEPGSPWCRLHQFGL